MKKCPVCGSSRFRKHLLKAWCEVCEYKSDREHHYRLVTEVKSKSGNIKENERYNKL